MKTRFLIMLLICVPSVALDQWSKAWATAHLAGKPSLSFLGGIFRMYYALNPGAWGGLGGMLPEATRKWIFTIGVGFFLVLLTWYILKQEHNRLMTVGLSLILSGGIGNLIDRALYGHVVDFLYLGYDPIGWLHTNIFNVADMAIMAGGALMLIYALSGHEPKAAKAKLKAQQDSVVELETQQEPQK